MTLLLCFIFQLARGDMSSMPFRRHLPFDFLWAFALHSSCLMFQITFEAGTGLAQKRFCLHSSKQWPQHA